MTRVFAGSVSLPGGEVLVAGGMFGHGNPIPQAVTITEIYDPISNTWRSAAPLASARYAFILSTFRGNQVIAIGGSRDGDNVWNEDSFVHEIDVYDPTVDRWETVAQMPQPAAFSAGTYLINDQNIWVTGGQTIESGDLILQATWIISPSQPRS